MSSGCELPLMGRWSEYAWSKGVCNVIHTAVTGEIGNTWFCHSSLGMGYVDATHLDTF